MIKLTPNPKFTEEYQWYDQGWNDRCDGKPCPSRNECSIHYWDGWQDCDSTPLADREKI